MTIIERHDQAARPETKEKIRRFIAENFLPSAGLGQEGFADDDSFMEKGIIDSTGVLELLEFLEENFRIKIEDQEVIPDNLDSLNKVSAFIQRKSELARQ
jgi:acyl carrier protein